MRDEKRRLTERGFDVFELEVFTNARLHRDFGRVREVRAGLPGIRIVEVVGVGPIEGMAGAMLVEEAVTPEELRRKVAEWATTRMWA